MLNLYQLHIFETVAQEGSFSRAAEQLYLTQPAVSQHIQTLEANLGVQLFRRGRRGIKLTSSGEILIDYTRCLLRLAEETRQAVTQVDQLDQPQQVNIGASPGVGIYLLPNWIRSFYHRHPNLTVTLKTAPTPAIIEAILTNEIKFGIVEGELHNQPLDWVPLWEEEIVIVVAANHPWQNQKTVDTAALNRQNFVVREKGSLTRAWEEKTLADNGISPQIIAEFDSPAAIKQAVASGLGVALLPRFVVQADANLHTLRLSTGLLVRTLKLIWGKDSLANQAVQAFISHLSNEFPHLPLQILDDAGELTLLNRMQKVRVEGSPATSA